jgi:hypothetical protein
MRRIAQVIVVAAALAGFPALADEDRDYVPGSERDPFSQTYIGQDPDEVRAARERELRAEIDRAVRAARERAAASACSCGHEHGA